MDLKGKVCLVTGGTKGIGAASALRFAQRGADVAVVGRNIDDDESQRTVERLCATGRRVHVMRYDMGVAEDCRQCVAAAASALGPIDVLVHSAGGPAPGGLLEITDQAWHKAFDVHVHAVFHLCRAVVPDMQKKKEGAIVLVGSVAGLRGLKTNIAYQAVKGAIPQIARGLAFELADHNIRVNAVAPGVIWTAFHSAATAPWRQNNIDNRIPLHREGTPEQVARVICELAENDYVTGETFTVDGGLTMRIC